MSLRNTPNLLGATLRAFVVCSIGFIIIMMSAICLAGSIYLGVGCLYDFNWHNFHTDITEMFPG